MKLNPMSLNTNFGCQRFVFLTGNFRYLNISYLSQLIFILFAEHLTRRLRLNLPEAQWCPETTVWLLEF